MKNYKQQIKEYKEEIEEKYVRAEAENKTVKACQNILSELVLSKQSRKTHRFLLFPALTESSLDQFPVRRQMPLQSPKVRQKCRPLSHHA